MSNRRVIGLPMIVLLFGIAGPSLAVQSTYKLTIRHVRSDLDLAIIADARTGRRIWQRRCTEVEASDISRDRRSIALVLSDGPLPDRLVLWHAGGRVREIDRLPLTLLQSKRYVVKDILASFGGIDQVAWSPDAQRLLIRSAAGEGGAAANIWTVWVMNVGSGQIELVGDSCSGSARWTDRRHVRYLQLDDVDNGGHSHMVNVDVK